MYFHSGLIPKASFFFLLVVLMIGSCKKEEIPGPKGEPGTPGGGGNSSISSSNVFTVTSSQWVPDTVAKCLKVTLAFPSITKEVVDNGAVKVFIKDGTAWAELPFTSGDLFTQFGFAEGFLYLKYINIEGQISFSAPTASYRMVIISPVK
jgi:hypothetical protein